MNTLWAILCGLKRGAQRAYGVDGKHLRRCPNVRGWITVDHPNGVHVVPHRDGLTHELWDQCPCGPATEVHTGNHGGDRWLITHHSLDGRENQEPK